jgi:hypothetical protein
MSRIEGVYWFRGCPVAGLLGSGMMMLVRDFCFDISFVEDVPDLRVTVPRLFLSDGTSSPRLLWPLVPRYGRYAIPGLIHDYLYFDPVVGDVELSRRECDVVYEKACERCGVSWFHRKMAYVGLRMFGGFTWRKLRRENERKVQ